MFIGAAVAVWSIDRAR